MQSGPLATRTENQKRISKTQLQNKISNKFQNTMQQQKSAVLRVSLVHAICTRYYITQHVSDVASCSRGNDASFACDAGGGSSLQPHLLSHDNAAHHARKDAIPPNHFRPCGNEHTGRRGDECVSCGNSTAAQEAPQQLLRECSCPGVGKRWRRERGGKKSAWCTRKHRRATSLRMPESQSGADALETHARHRSGTDVCMRASIGR
jgi:hypothetical protein